MEPRGWFVGLVMASCALGALGAMAARAGRDAETVELQLEGIVRVRSGQQILVLAEKNGARRLPVPVTSAEAAMIEHAQRGQRGLTVGTLEALGGRVLRASIDGVTSGGRLSGHLAIRNNAGELQVEAAPGEALALAIAAGAPIVADDEVLEEAGITLEGLRGKAVNQRRREVEPAPVLDI